MAQLCLRAVECINFFYPSVFFSWKVILRGFPRQAWGLGRRIKKINFKNMIGKIIRGKEYLIAFPEPPKDYDVKKEEKKLIKWFKEVYQVKINIIWIPNSNTMQIWEVKGDEEKKKKEKIKT